MKALHENREDGPSDRGSVLIIVLWVCLGLVALALYFANSVSSELRAADYRASETTVRQAVVGGERYASHILATYALNGVVPDSSTYQSETMQVGDAYVWFIGRDPNNPPTTTPTFGLVDEASKLNLNTASASMLEGLPNMTPDLAAAIVAWRSSASSQSSSASNINNLYTTLDPPRLNKGAPFETIDELRLVYGATLSLLFGEDTNRNGTLDPNEDDGDKTAPHDNQDGQLQPGILEYVTVYSQQPNVRADGTRRVNITTAQSRTGLQSLLQSRFGASRAAAILNRLGNAPLGSVAEFYVNSGLSASEFNRIHLDVTATQGSTSQGLVNVNTACATVLACLPGIGQDNATKITAFRLAHPDQLTSFAWLPGVIGRAAFLRAGPYITDQSYQFSADVSAVSTNGKGYHREKIVFDMSKGVPRMIYRQDLSSYGWALGSQVRQLLKSGQIPVTNANTSP